MRKWTFTCLALHVLMFALLCTQALQQWQPTPTAKDSQAARPDLRSETNPYWHLSPNTLTSGDIDAHANTQHKRNKLHIDSAFIHQNQSLLPVQLPRTMLAWATDIKL